MNRRCIQLARAEKPHEARKSTSQCHCKRLIETLSFLLQPQTQDDERAGYPVEFTVETGDETVAPENRQRVVPKLALAKRLVDLPYVVEAEQQFGSPTGADMIERREEDNLFYRGGLQWRPGRWHAPGA